MLSKNQVVSRRFLLLKIYSNSNNLTHNTNLHNLSITNQQTQILPVFHFKALFNHNNILIQIKVSEVSSFPQVIYKWIKFNSTNSILKINQISLHLYTAEQYHLITQFLEDKQLYKAQPQRVLLKTFPFSPIFYLINLT